MFWNVSKYDTQSKVNKALDGFKVVNKYSKMFTIIAVNIWIYPNNKSVQKC